MSSTALKKKLTPAEQKRMSLKAQLGQPNFVLEQMAGYMKDGDVSSITDLIASYVQNSPKYNSQDEFAEAIGTTRQTLHRMFSHNDKVSMKVFFGAIEQIFEDGK
jgi:hypothetical protein